MTNICLITGCTSGIGEALVFEMIRRGWMVLGVGRNEKKLTELTERFSERIFKAFVCDVTDIIQVKKIYQNLKVAQIIPNTLYLNAGIGPLDPEVFSTNVHKDIFSINYFGVMNWVEVWLADAISENFPLEFIVTSSVSGIMPFAGSAGYNASKAAVNMCFDTLDIQYSKLGIRFNYMMPGPVETPLLEGQYIKGMIQPNGAAYLIANYVLNKKYHKIFPVYWNLFSFVVSKLPRKIKQRLLSF